MPERYVLRSWIGREGHTRRGDIIKCDEKRAAELDKAGRTRPVTAKDKRGKKGKAGQEQERDTTQAGPQETKEGKVSEGDSA